MKHTQNSREIEPTSAHQGRFWQAITYQEWDVNPRGAGPGPRAERIVTGSDGSARYATDHYHTFYRIR
jgi:guanyl-specific ribonuclease Sa